MIKKEERGNSMPKKDTAFIPIGFFIIYMSILSYPYVYDSLTLAVLIIAFIMGLSVLGIGIKLLKP